MGELGIWTSSTDSFAGEFLSTFERSLSCARGTGVQPCAAKFLLSVIAVEVLLKCRSISTRVGDLSLDNSGLGAAMQVHEEYLFWTLGAETQRILLQ
jgi:hypothetical protein